MKNKKFWIVFAGILGFLIFGAMGLLSISRFGKPDDGYLVKYGVPVITGLVGAFIFLSVPFIIDFILKFLDVGTSMPISRNQDTTNPVDNTGKPVGIWGVVFLISLGCLPLTRVIKNPFFILLIMIPLVTSTYVLFKRLKK